MKKKKIKKIKFLGIYNEKKQQIPFDEKLIRESIELKDDNKDEKNANKKKKEMLKKMEEIEKRIQDKKKESEGQNLKKIEEAVY